MPEPAKAADLPVRISPCQSISCTVLVRMPKKRTQSREGLYYSYKNRLNDCFCPYSVIGSVAECLLRLAVTH